MAYLIALGILCLAAVVATAWLIRTDGYGHIPPDPTRTPPRERAEPAPTRTLLRERAEPAAAASPGALPSPRAARPEAHPAPRTLPTPRAATPPATTPISCPTGSRLA